MAMAASLVAEAAAWQERSIDGGGCAVAAYAAAVRQRWQLGGSATSAAATAHWEAWRQRGGSGGGRNVALTVAVLHVGGCSDSGSGSGMTTGAKRQPTGKQGANMRGGISRQEASKRQEDERRRWHIKRHRNNKPEAPAEPPPLPCPPPRRHGGAPHEIPSDGGGGQVFFEVLHSFLCRHHTDRFLLDGLPAKVTAGQES